MMNEQTVRAAARRLWDGQRSEDRLFTEQVDAYLSRISLEPEGKPSCHVCEGILCGVWALP